MDIGPIGGIRPISLVRPSSPASNLNPDLAGVSAVELCDQQKDDSYSPSRNASRGLEDEDSEEVTTDLHAALEQQDTSENSINFFA